MEMKTREKRHQNKRSAQEKQSPNEVPRVNRVFLWVRKNVWLFCRVCCWEFVKNHQATKNLMTYESVGDWSPIFCGVKWRRLVVVSFVARSWLVRGSNTVGPNSRTDRSMPKSCKRQALPTYSQSKIRKQSVLWLKIFWQLLMGEVSSSLQYYEVGNHLRR